LDTKENCKHIRKVVDWIESTPTEEMDMIKEKE